MVVLRALLCIVGHHSFSDCARRKVGGLQEKRCSHDQESNEREAGGFVSFVPVLHVGSVETGHES